MGGGRERAAPSELSGQKFEKSIGVGGKFPADTGLESALWTCSRWISLPRAMGVGANSLFGCSGAIATR